MKNSLLFIGLCFFAYHSSLQAATYGGGSGTSADPYQIWTAAQLNTIGLNSSDMYSCFILMDDIDMSAYIGTTYNIISTFRGTFDGNGYVIRNLSYSTTTATTYVGLFGQATNATIENVHLENVNFSVNGRFVGALIGYMDGCTVTNCSSIGNITSSNSAGTLGIGGLIGCVYSGTITDSCTAGSVSGTLSSTSSYYDACVGGLVGWHTSGTITNCSSEASVAASSAKNYARVGGLIGYQGSSYGSICNITKCYSTGSVSGTTSPRVYAGGLVGYRDALSASTATRCGCTGAVTASATTYAYAGGMFGYLTTSLANCYSTGAVNSSAFITFTGGLAGYTSYASLSKCYSAGTISAAATSTAYTGGSIGYREYTSAGGCFWDTSTSGQSTAAGYTYYYSTGITGKTTSEMKTLSTFTSAGWDFRNNDGNAADWYMPQDSYPLLYWQIDGKIVATPEFSLDSGTYDGPQTVIITCATPDAEIHYTTDGTDPTETDTLIASGESVWIPDLVTLKARAWKSGLQTSLTQTAEYVINFVCATPEFYEDGGSYDSKQYVTLYSPTSGAVIHYTTDGTDPDETSPAIESGCSVLVSRTMILRARAYKDSLMPSDTKTASYQINLACPVYDVTGDCFVDMNDFYVVSQWWMSECASHNDWCYQTDTDISGQIDTADIILLTEEWLNQSPVANHIDYISLWQVWNYGITAVSTDNTYDFGFNMQTDGSVSAVEFTTPAGMTCQIPSGELVTELVSEGYFTSGRLVNGDGTYVWTYICRFFDSASLAAYGDGDYTITVYYVDGRTQQTTASKVALHQPTQMPVITSFNNGDTLTSPVTFTWEACTDPQVQNIWLFYASKDNSMVTNSYLLDASATGLEAPEDLPAGQYFTAIGFQLQNNDTNTDGIPVVFSKTSQSSYYFIVESDGSSEE